MPNKGRSVIKLDKTAQKSMRSPLQNRRAQSNSMLGGNLKCCQLGNKASYKSPLTHLGRSNVTQNLDDSVMVVEELRKLPSVEIVGLSIGGKRRRMEADDSVIILSDNEEEPEEERKVAQRNCSVILKVPRRNLSKTNPQAEVICIDSLPGIETGKNVSPTAISTTAVNERVNNTRNNSHSTESSSQPALIVSDVLVNSAAAEQLTSLRCVQTRSKHKDCSIFCIDTEGDPSSLDRLNGKKRKARQQKSRKKPRLENPNSAMFANNEASDGSLSEGQAVPTNQSEINGVRSSDGSPPEGQAIPINQTEINGIWSSDRLYSRRQTVPTNQPKVNRLRSSKRLYSKRQAVPMNEPQMNRVRSYHTEETIIKRPGSLRDIIVDGCNIAMSFKNDKSFSEAGLKLVIDYFKLRGHTVIVFIPHHQRSAKRELLEKLHAEGIVVFTPSRKIGGRKIVSYDDRYILDYATLCGGIVVSRDQYRDLYQEKPEWKNTIENRLLVPTFVGNCVMFPEDPLGRHGPKLEEFLRH